MASIPDSKKPLLKKLYQKDGKSMREIAEYFDVSIDAVVYFMRCHDIPRRSPAETNAFQFERKSPSFSVKDKRDKNLESLGIALYWAEGAKSAGATGVDFANSDPKMIVTFLNFLRDRYKLREEKFRVYIYCHSDQNITSLIQFWSHITSIPKGQFTKPYVREALDHTNTMQYGLVHIRYHDKKLLNDIKNLIQSYAQKYASVDP